MTHIKHFGALCLCLSLSACAGMDDEIGSVDQPIVGGTLNSGDPAVVAIYAQTGQNGSLCTGSLIAPDIVLTAAHCLDRIGTPDSHIVYFGNDISTYLGGGQDPSFIAAIDVGEFDYDRQFTDQPNQALFEGHDIGVIRLAQAAPVTPIAINRQPLDPFIGNPIRLTGFGVSQADTNTSGVKRVADATLEDATVPLALYGAPNAQNPDAYTNTCSGDSGGPTFMTIGGQELVVGITSFGDENCLQLGASTRVDTYSTFIDTFVGGGCEADGVCGAGCATPDPDCGAPGSGEPGEGGSEPGTDGSGPGGGSDTSIGSGCSAGGSLPASSSLLLLGLVGLLRRRRR